MNSQVNAWLIVLVLFTTVARAGDVEVVISVVKSGRVCDGSSRGFPAWVLRAEVANRTDATIPVAYWSCGWFDSFLVRPSSSLYVSPWDCAGNAPIERSLRPGESMTFLVPIFSVTSEVPHEPKRVVLGFESRRLARRGDGFHEMFEDDSALVWSNSVVLPPIGDDLIHREGKIEKAAQPGATDNPDDAQRLREDH